MHTNPYQPPVTVDAPAPGIYPFVFRAYSLWSFVHYQIVYLGLKNYAAWRPEFQYQYYLFVSCLLFTGIEILFLHRLSLLAGKTWLLAIVPVRAATHLWVSFIDPAHFPLSFQILDYSGQILLALSLLALPLIRRKLIQIRLFFLLSMFVISVSIASNFMHTDDSITELTLALITLFSLFIAFIESIVRIPVFWNIRPDDVRQKPETLSVQDT